jgi:Leucine-rich repeat (LRR) protein
MITADFKPNKLLATNKANAAHNEIKSRIEIAKKSNSLHLSQLNLDVVLPQVFKMTNLIRLDLSFNNLVRIDPLIGELSNL